MTRILFVDDNSDLREVFQTGLERSGFEVVTAGSVNEALKLISTESFDVLLSDLHMPEAGDGMTVVSAMRHTHPDAVTMVMSGYPALHEALEAILLQVDEVLVKPVSFSDLAEVIKKRLSSATLHVATNKERVAGILERDLQQIIARWMYLVERNPELTAIPLRFEDRSGHLPHLLRDLVLRLRLVTNASIPVSTAAWRHGSLRRLQGYTVPMIVEESRILQVCIFNTLQNNLATVDFSTVLLDVMTIADEVDSQLKQAVLGFQDPLTISQRADLSGVDLRPQAAD
jgi:CheY-like chemotaxis protein